MKLNYVPGIPLRLFPGLSRELYDAVDTYTATNSKIAIFTGSAPTETELWNLTNYNDYLTSKASSLVYSGTFDLEFSYDGQKQKRKVQKMPIDSIAITAGVDSSEQLQADLDAGSIKTDNSLYALIYCADKDTTLNTTGNDLILLVSDVGSSSSNFCNISKTTFASGDSLYFRNLTISLFQSYIDTNTPIMDGDIQIGTKKSIYVNKIWGNRLSESYRDCIISKTSLTFKAGSLVANVVTPSWGSYMNDYCVGSSQHLFSLRDLSGGSIWLNGTLDAWMNTKANFGYLVNEDTITLIELINSKAINGDFVNSYSMISESNSYVASTRFIYNGTLPVSGLPMDLIPGLLVKYILNQSQSTAIQPALKKLLIELGFDTDLVDNALRCIIPIDFKNSDYASSFDNDSGVLTVQNASPAKLDVRYKQTKQNPDNKTLYIYIPRYFNRCAIENPYGSSQIGATVGTLGQGLYGSISSAAFVSNTTILEGDTVSNSTQKIRISDYTGISIGISGNGLTDLEYDVVDTIDYIDSFTTMFKIPNKY